MFQRHAAVLDQDTQRVGPQTKALGISVPGKPPDVTLRGDGAPRRTGSKRSSVASPVGHLRRGRPVGHVLGVGRIVDRLNLLACFRCPIRAEEEGARGVARPGVLGFAAADDPGDLEAGAEDVLIGGASRARRRRRLAGAARVDTDLAAGDRAAVDPVDAEDADAPREETESARAAASAGAGRRGVAEDRRSQQHRVRGSATRREPASASERHLDTEPQPAGSSVKFWIPRSNR